jgi:hypothetical protein
LAGVLGLFGWQFVRKEKVEEQVPSFAPKETNDGAVLIAAGSGYGTYVDLDGTVRTEAELVTKYREMSLHPECDAAIDEIINETMSIDENTIVDINLDEMKLADPVKKAIQAEFLTCQKLLDFQRHAYDIYRRWYIDGRLYYHVIIDPKHPEKGVIELRYVDPRKIRKVREISKQRSNLNNPGPAEAVLMKVVNEYYIFNDKGFNYGNKIVGPSTNGMKVAKDAVLHVVSGLTDNQGTMVLSYLHKAIKALNQLRTLEDALVIYRLARAPERRIWYIDVGNLPKMKAEQYVRDVMVKHKNRLIYDANSGEIRDDRKFMTMLEDYWLPRREGGKGTQVDILPGGQTLGQMDDVLYFQKKFLNALNVPISRLNSDALFSVGRATEITRDELKFVKFISRLRNQFASLFTELLKKQVVLKKIMSIEDFEKIQNDIRYDFACDQYFTELKKAEIMQNRINLARAYQDMVGKYYSHLTIRKDILHQTEDEIKENDNEIMAESATGDPRFINPIIVQNEQMADAAIIQKAQMQQQAGEMVMQHVAGQAAMTPEGQAAAQQQQQAQMQQQQELQAQQEQDQQRHSEIHNAATFVRQMKQRNKHDRSLQDEARLKSATQKVAKNRNYMKEKGIKA